MSLSLLAIHAHPDDESSKGAGTVNLYSSQGIRTTLVCCTGGEAGDILNPAMDKEEVRQNLAAVRRSELDTAAGIIGYDEVIMLGYRDSGRKSGDRLLRSRTREPLFLDPSCGYLGRANHGRRTL